jgi:hypothetical protein
MNQTIGAIITDESLPFGIESKGTARPEGDFTQVHQGT